MAHTAVLLNEAVDALVQDRGGCYVDCTYGRGGHASEILSRLDSNGRLVAIDRDLDAIDDARMRFRGDARVISIHGSFGDLERHVAASGCPALSGVLLDLGVSSPQLEDAQRGFSFDRDGPLDMRMNRTSGVNAAEWIAAVSEDELTAALRRYGEERYARRIARRVVACRADTPIERTRQLVEIVEEAVPTRERGRHPATRTFQAIRIVINDELSELERCLDQALNLLCRGGRLVVISFHSLEDRIVKRFMREEQRGDPFPSKLPIRDAELQRRMKVVGRAVKPARAEIERNRRARSAVMRVGEKVA